MDKATLDRAIQSCDRAPIHVPGAIQSFGFLFATDLAVEHIEAASANLAPALDCAEEDLLDTRLSDILDHEQLHLVRNVLSHDTSSAQREFVCMTTFAGRELQVSAHRKGPHAIVELIPERSEHSERFAPMDEARRFLVRDPELEHPSDILEAAVGRLRALVGYDRVKAYVFLPEADGEVIAESRRAGMPSFLGLRFPSTDIPPRARRLYATTPLRLIANTRGENVPLVVRHGAPTDIDLSLAVLRGTELVHDRYLQNMKLGGTLSIPVVARGELFGLFACHNNQERIPDASTLMAAELAGKLISLQVEHALQRRQQSEFRRCTSIASQIFVADDSELTAGPNMLRMASDLKEVLSFDGLVMRIGSELHCEGTAPDDVSCRRLLDQDGYDADGILAMNGLREALPDVEWGPTAGALILNLSAHPDIRLAFLREESQRNLNWAGAPTKTIEKTEDGVQLTPRSSFEQYVRKSAGRCDDWSTDDMTSARALRGLLVDALGIQKSKREERLRLGLLVRELNHRVRNILSLVQSLSVQSRASATSIEHYAELLEQRIIALSSAHSLLTRNNLDGVSLRELAELELKPFGRTGASTKCVGPDIWLRPESAPIIALVLHELASNAAKYGSLSTDGHVELSWSVADYGLSVLWRETGGPRVEPPTKQGFGRSIIEHAVPYEADGRAELRFEPTGVQADLWLPGEILCVPDGSTDRPVQRVVDQGVHQTGSKLEQPSIDSSDERKRPALIVEDNYLVAIEARRLLEDSGFGPVHTAATVPEALFQLENTRYKFCLLDVDLQGNLSTPVAAQLRRDGTPFVFATGYGSDGTGVSADISEPIVHKPLDSASLRAALEELSADGE